MNYAVRHEGSPTSVAGLSAKEVIAGLQDGRWAPTDEVCDDDNPDWGALEDHPHFAEAAAEIEPPPRKEHPDETRLDMNPLIDVALVLLIFFILTTTYETIRKVLDLPGASAKAPGKVRQVDEQTVKKLTIVITVRQVNGQPVIRIEDRVVRLDELDAVLRQTVKASAKNIVLLDAAPDVDYGAVMAVMDAARGARITKTYFALPAQKKPSAPASK